MTLRKEVFSVLTTYPTFTKGDIVSYLSLTDITEETSKVISKGIWDYNTRSGRRGGYSTTLTQ